MEIFRNKLTVSEGVETTSIDADFNDAGHLIISGQDMGPSVEMFWGDSDYEYYLSISNEDVNKLCLVLLKEGFNSISPLGFSEVRELCKENNINTEFNYWAWYRAGDCTSSKYLTIYMPFKACRVLKYWYISILYNTKLLILLYFL